MKRHKKEWKNIAGYLSGEMDKNRRVAFLEEAMNKKQLKKDLYIMEKAWNQHKSVPENKYADTGKAWEKFYKKLDSEGMINNKKPEIAINSSRYILRIAAVILLVLAVGIPSTIKIINNETAGVDVIDYESDNGIMTIDLPDGSRVFMNEGAKLKYDSEFQEDRNITFKGEGYFDVMADPDRPFRIATGKVVVTVLGTSFNIRECRNNSVEVLVESGKVRLSLENTNEEAILTPGQMGIAGKQIIVNEQDDENYLSWKTKEFKFVDEKIENIIGILEDAYHVRVKSGKIDLKDLRLTTSYKEQSFDAILSTICTAFNLNYVREGKVYILQEK